MVLSDVTSLHGHGCVTWTCLYHCTSRICTFVPPAMSSSSSPEADTPSTFHSHILLLVLFRHPPIPFHTEPVPGPILHLATDLSLTLHTLDIACRGMNLGDPLDGMLTRPSYSYTFRPSVVSDVEQARSLTPTPSERVPLSSVHASPFAQNSLSGSNSNRNRTSIAASNSASTRTSTSTSHRDRDNPAPSSASSFRPGRTHSLVATSTRHRLRSHLAHTRDPLSSSAMSRPGTSQRPSYIALPSTPFGRSPYGSPLNTPGGNPAPAPIASPTSPRNSFLPSFMRNRSRAATITGRGASPNVEAPNPLAGTMSRGSGSNTSTGRDGGGVTRSVSTPISGGLAANSGGSIGSILTLSLRHGVGFESHLT